MPELFKHLSVVQMAALFCLSSLALTWLGAFIFQRLVHSWIHGRRNANEMIGLTMTAFSALYGILLGLLAVEAYQDFSAVKEGFQGGPAIAALHKDFGGLPPPLRDELQENLRAYAREAIDAVHPPPGVPQDPHSSSPGLNALFALIMNFQPKLKSEEMIQSETFTRLNTLVEHRRYLIAAGDDGIPSELWWVVCVGGILLIVLCGSSTWSCMSISSSAARWRCFSDRSFLIAALDNPFNGGLTVGSSRSNLC
ncbi:MAG: hypothetical protein U1E25_12325 [Methylocystis sp.]